MHLNIQTHPRPRALDLFCGGGGAGVGLRQAGFRTVVGVDKFDHKTSYEHHAGMHFHQSDIKQITLEFVQQFDFVWASPPCQAHSCMVFKYQRDKFLKKWQREGRHLDYIPYTRLLLQMSEVPFVIENVGGAKKALGGELLKLCGTMMDPPLQVFRHRFFERGNGMPIMTQPECRHENCSLGSLGKGAKVPERERMSKVALVIRRKGGVPPGFKRVEKRYASHPDRVDYVYYGATPRTTSKIRKAYKRDYCRSVKEALRITGDITPVADPPEESAAKATDVKEHETEDGEGGDEGGGTGEGEGEGEGGGEGEGEGGRKRGHEGVGQTENAEQEKREGEENETCQECEVVDGAQDVKGGETTRVSKHIQMYPIYGLQLARGQTSEWRMAMGLDEDHMSRDEIRESIPPAYSKYIGKLALKYVRTLKRSAPPLRKRRNEKVIRVVE